MPGNLELPEIKSEIKAEDFITSNSVHNNNAYYVQDNHTLSELNSAPPQQYTPNSSTSSSSVVSAGGATGPENPVDLSNSRPPVPTPHDQRVNGGLLHESNWQNSEANKYGYPNRYGG